MVYFPKGFTDADYASVYVTNVACDMDEVLSVNDAYVCPALSVVHVCIPQ